MYVDVIACKRERIKVDVTLAKRSAVRTAPTVVSLTARKAAAFEYDAPDAVEVIDVVDEPTEDFCRDDSASEAVSCDSVPSEQTTESDMAEDTCDEQEIASVMELLALTGDAAESEDILPSVSLFDSVSTADEDLTAIDELLAGADDEISEDIFDDIVADALDELEDMNRRADVMRERLDGDLAQALEELSGSTDEESEELTSVICKELESLDSVFSQRDTAAAQPEEPELPLGADVGAYMRYFDRDTQGGRVEVSRDNATGQEVICYDEASGRLSRVCGIIKKDGDRSDNI